MEETRKYPEMTPEEEINDDEEVDETNDGEYENINTEEIDETEQLRRKLESLNDNSEREKFPRIETKPEFASEVINVLSNQKVANLDNDEIIELLNKRKFMNKCNTYGWDIVAKMAAKSIEDIENYSLSKEGFLVKNVLVDHSKQAIYNYEKQLNKRKGGKLDV